MLGGKVLKVGLEAYRFLDSHWFLLSWWVWGVWIVGEVSVWGVWSIVDDGVAWIESCVEKILLGMRAMVLVRLLVRQGTGLFDPFC
ncbi:hypothetical protein HanHA300_Chr09g0300181 [Helianthus annuus]|nr:hypothetical protein HanHA300_Chr09g0300181 [Helianthus annuus]